MTTTVIVHNAHRNFTVKTLDRVFKDGKPTDDYTVTSYAMKAGEMFQTHATDTRKIEVSEE